MSKRYARCASDSLANGNRGLNQDIARAAVAVNKTVPPASILTEPVYAFLRMVRALTSLSPSKTTKAPEGAFLSD